MVVNSKYTAIKVFLYFINFLSRHMNIIAFKMHGNAQLPEFFGNNAQLFYAGIFNGNIALRHCGKANKTAHFNHIG